MMRLRCVSVWERFRKIVMCPPIFDDERVMRRRRPVVAPGEMEEVKLKKEQLLKYPDLKQIIFKVEEA